MTQKDRSETREMIQVTLAGWHDSTVEREKLIYLSLNNIDSHLEKLNGKVSSHEKIILENLPHSIDHCPQTPVIKEIRDAVLKDEGGKINKEITFSRVINIAAIVIAFVVMWQGYKSLLKEAKNTKSEVQVTNDAILKGQTRGQEFNPFVKDTAK